MNKFETFIERIRARNEHLTGYGSKPEPFVGPNHGDCEAALREYEIEMQNSHRDEMIEKRYWFALLYERRLRQFHMAVYEDYMDCGIDSPNDFPRVAPAEVSPLHDQRRWQNLQKMAHEDGATAGSTKHATRDDESKLRARDINEECPF